MCTPPPQRRAQLEPPAGGSRGVPEAAAAPGLGEPQVRAGPQVRGRGTGDGLRCGGGAQVCEGGGGASAEGLQWGKDSGAGLR